MEHMLETNLSIKMKLVCLNVVYLFKVFSDFFHGIFFIVARKFILNLLSLCLTEKHKIIKWMSLGMVLLSKPEYATDSKWQ